jgi:toluene monooxygenase system protein E
MHRAGCGSSDVRAVRTGRERQVSIQECFVAVLNRDDWYDIACDVEWTLSYVAKEDACPAERQGAAGIGHQDAAEAFVDQALADIDRRHSPRWLFALGTLLTPQRYPVHGLQMLAAYVAQMAPSSDLTNAAAFQATDELRRVQRIAHRTRQLDLAHPALGFGRTERSTFETHPRWQAARAAIEALLVAFEWDEAFTALELVIKPAYDEIFVRQLAEACRRAGDELDALVLDSLWRDAERTRRWSTALVRFALSRADNRAAFEHHVARWRPLASKLLREGAALLAARGGGDAAAIARSGERALDELHARAGLTPA